MASEESSRPDRRDPGSDPVPEVRRDEAGAEHAREVRRDESDADSPHPNGRSRTPTLTRPHIRAGCRGASGWRRCAGRCASSATTA